MEVIPVKSSGRWVCYLLLLCLMLGALGGGAASAEASGAKPFEGVTLVWMMIPATDNAETAGLIDMVYESTGITIEKRIVPEALDGEMDRILIRLLAGDTVDILYNATPKMKPLIQAGVLLPLDDLAADAGYDMQAIFGDYLPSYGGHTWALPAFTDIWLTLYNKAVFDNAGIPYPTAEGWTWDEYIRVAGELTNIPGGVYGSLMLDYNCYNYMYAVQHGASHYTAEGLSNYGDPIFTEGFDFFYSLGSGYKIQPSMREFTAGNIPWDAFFTQQAEYGMFVCGGWALQMMAETASYPRNWQFGLLPMPYPEGQTPSTLTLTGSYAIPTTSSNQEAALAAIACIAENQYTLGYGRIPARRDMSAADVDAYIETRLIPTYAADGITVEDVRAAWFDPGRIAYDEKIIGPADSRIDNIWVSIGQQYSQGMIPLERAMVTIRTEADEAILASGELTAE